MFRRTAVIADADKASARNIKRTLSRRGYKVILTDTARYQRVHRLKRNIDLLILFGYAYGSDISRNVAENGLIIVTDRLDHTVRKLKAAAVLSSYGSEQLLRERCINSDIDVRFIRIGSGWCSDPVESGIHHFAEADISSQIADTAALHFAGSSINAKKRQPKLSEINGRL